jgi:ABC-type phosphate transport system substrate-binding protein
MRSLTAFTLALLALLTALVATVFAQPRPVYVVITHPSNTAPVVDRKFVEDAFLKKTTRWPDGRPIRPVDLAPDSPVRRKFSEDVLNRSVAVVKGYWQQKIFSGRDVPPPEVDSDKDAVRYVLKNEGSIGYVSGSADLGGSRVLVVQ